LIHHSLEEEYADHKHPHVGIVSALALAGHSFMDGVGIGLGFQVNPTIGLLVAIAVIAHDFTDGMKIGIKIIKEAVQEPAKMILENGGQNSSIILSKVIMAEDKPYSWGYNSLSDTYEDLIETGVIDPVKVTRVALQNAASVASLLLTTEAVIVEKKEKTPTPTPSQNDGQGMY